ncbi:MAG: WD40 repeat domain-containing protein [Cyanobacteria bacterium P01_C01_bin.70]
MSKRQRGVVLTNHGKERLEAAIAAAQEREKDGKRFTQAELEERSYLSTKTIKKICQAQAGVDRSKIEDLFRAFELTLEAADYGVPEVTTAELPQQKWRDRTPKIDLLEAPDASIFYGREAEMLLLRQWVLEDKCRLIGLIGMGGMGKTALSVRLVESVQAEFQYVIWCSLREAPPVEKILGEVVRFLSDQQEADLPEAIADASTRLVHYLNQARCLVILDNAESVLAGNARAGQYRDGYEGYSTLIQRVGEARHQSCIVLTSREKPKELARLEGRSSPVRSYVLQGLEEFSGQEFLKAEGIDRKESSWRQVFNYYSGNPLALKIVANIIRDLFSGNTDTFLKQGSGIFGDIYDLLDQQFERLTKAGQSILYWLAINRDVTSIEELKEDLIEEDISQNILENLDSLKRRSLVEVRKEGFTLQNVIMEYVTERLTTKVKTEIDSQEIILLNSHALLKATAKDYVRETQALLILKPTKEYFEQHGKTLLDSFRRHLKEQPTLAKGYYAGNLFNLLFYSGSTKYDFKDFSELVILQAYLGNSELHGLNFQKADFRKYRVHFDFGSISCIKFSKNGKFLAAGGNKGMTCIWRFPNKKSYIKLEKWGISVFSTNLATWINTLDFTQDNSFLATGDDGYQIKLYNLETLGPSTVTHFFTGHTEAISSLVFNQDGSKLASCSSDKTVRIWDVSNHKCVHSFKEKDSWFCCLAFHANGNLLAGGGFNYIKLWDIKKQKCVHSFLQPTGRIFSLAFNEDLNILAAGGSDGVIWIWNLDSKHFCKQLSGHTQHVHAIAFSPDKRKMVSSGDDNTIRLWNVEDFKCEHVFKGHRNSVHALSFDSTSSLLVSGSFDCTIKFWDIQAKKCTQTFKGYSNATYAVETLSNQDLIASAYEDMSIRVWSLSREEVVQNLSGHTDYINSIAIHPNNNILASSSDNGEIILWDLEDGGSSIQFVKNPGYANCLCLTFSIDGDFLVSAGSDSCIRIWDLKKRSFTTELLGHTKTIKSLSFSRSGKLLASASSDETVRLWDFPKRSFLGKIAVKKISIVTFSPDSRIIASGGKDKLIRLWRSNDLSSIACLEGHENQVNSVIFHPDMSVLASASNDKTIRIWDLESHECIRIIGEDDEKEMHRGKVGSVRFSQNGAILISASEDGLIKIWRTSDYKCISVLQPPRPYEGTNISGVTGIMKFDKRLLASLGAIDDLPDK